MTARDELRNELAKLGPDPDYGDLDNPICGFCGEPIDAQLSINTHPVWMGGAQFHPECLPPPSDWDVV